MSRVRCVCGTVYDVTTNGAGALVGDCPGFACRLARGQCGDCGVAVVRALRGPRAQRCPPCKRVRTRARNTTRARERYNDPTSDTRAKRHAADKTEKVRQRKREWMAARRADDTRPAAERRAADRRYYQRQREVRLAYAKQRHAATRERRLAQMRAWRLANADRLQQDVRERAALNKRVFGTTKKPRLAA